MTEVKTTNFLLVVGRKLKRLPLFCVVVKLLGEMAKQTIFTHSRKLSRLVRLRTYTKTALRQAGGSKIQLWQLLK